MRFRFYLGLLTALFLIVAWFFISHAYVFIRLTTVLGFLGSLALLLFAIVCVGRILK